MDLIKFSVATTNVFPMANSKHGGQLTTEFNLRSRESVATDSNVRYIIGPSYTHSLRDFLVTAGETSGVYPGSSGQTTNNRTTVLTIKEGRAVINGHYVESLAPITIDLSELNAELRKKSMEPLKGKLCIGIRIMYHTYYTMAGSIEQENDDDMYEGIHVVILPKSQFKLPSDVPENPDQVTAHLKLAEFTYNNGYISALEDNKHRVEMMGMDRIGDAESALSDYFITRQGLDPGSHYVLSGKKLQENKGYWCRADNSLIEWDIATDTRLRTQSEIANMDDIDDPGNTKISKYKSEYAQFEIADREYHWAGSSKNQRDKLSHSPIQPGDVVLRMPHKQIDGYKSGTGEPMYFIDSRIPLINANYADRTPGIMTKDIIDRMHSIDEKINTYYRLPAGQMRAYIPILTDRSDLPPIPLSKSKGSGYVEYQIKETGLTLNDIAEKFGIAVEDLLAANRNLNSYLDIMNMNAITNFSSMLEIENSGSISKLSNYIPVYVDGNQQGYQLPRSCKLIFTNSSDRGVQIAEYIDSTMNVIAYLSPGETTEGLDALNYVSKYLRVDIATSTSEYVVRISPSPVVPSDSISDELPVGLVINIPVEHVNSIYGKISYLLSNIDARLTDVITRMNTIDSTLQSKVEGLVEDSAAGLIADGTAPLIEKDTQLDTKDVELSQQIIALQDAISVIQQQLISASAQSGSSSEPTLADVKAQLDALQASFDELQAHVTGSNGLDSQINAVREWTTNNKISIERLDAELADLQSTITESITEIIEDKLPEVINIADAYITDQLSNIQKSLDSRFELLTDRLHSEYNFVDGWKAGDYVLVGQDQTVGVMTDGRYPTTAYVVVPGYLQSGTSGDSLTYIGKINLKIGYPYAVDNSSFGPLDKWTIAKQQEIITQYQEIYELALDTVQRTVPTSCIWGAQIGYAEITEDQQSSAENGKYAFDDIWGANIETIRGVPNLDYLVASHLKEYDNDGYLNQDSFGNIFDEHLKYKIKEYTRYFYTPRYAKNDLEYDINPIFITSSIPLATEDQVGGFLNVDSGELGNGYIYRDENGHLRLVDYDLLYSGVLAYQLGTDYNEGAGVSLDDLQNILDNYINNRIAFPTLEKLGNAIDAGYSLNQAYVIHITITLNSEYEGTLNFYNIDSRFGTKVYLEFLGECDDKLTINVANCERMRIYMGEDVNPNLKLDNVELWYSPDIMNRASSINQLRLWYAKFEDTDPEYEIDGMRVYSAQDPVPVEAVENFSTYDANDNHFAYAIRSMTFGSDGCPTDMELYITDSTTAVDLSDGDDISMFANTLAMRQTSSFQFPEKLMTHRLKVTGQFITAFKASESEEWTLKENQFTLLTNKNDENNLLNGDYTLGTISILSKIQYISAYTGDAAFGDQIDGWQPGRWHIFSGGRID